MVVATVSVEVTAAAPVMLAEDGIEQVAGLVALAGLVVTAQLRVTAPVNPLEGVTLIVEVFPVVAPAATLIAPLLLSEKLAAGFTVTLTGVLDVIVPVAASVPVTVTA